MLALSAGSSPSLVKNCFFLDFKAAFFHVSAVCQDYFNYVKRKWRADAKRDLLKWRTSFDVYTYIFDQPFFGSKFRLKSQKQQNGDQKCYFRWSEDSADNSRRKKRKKSKQADREASKEFRNDPFQFIWQSRSCHYSQWWGFCMDSFFQDFSSSNERRSNFNSWFSTSGDSTGKKKLKTVGSPSDRKTLGLSPTGPLTMDEVKKAFRLSALKWHPDMHESASKVMAEEKFKDCGAAYKSLLNALANS